MDLTDRIDRVLASLQSERRRPTQRQREEQVRKGTREELAEHGKTIRRVKRHPKMPVREVAEQIAREHVRRDPRYYDKLEAVEKASRRPKRQRGLKPPRIKLLGRRGRLRIYLVDGKWVREHKHIDFVHGGHDVVYDFVPRFEVWIDDTLMPDEIPFVVWHELYERRRMSRDGLDYNTAHDLASKHELEWRQGKRGFKVALRGEKGQ